VISVVRGGIGSAVVASLVLTFALSGCTPTPMSSVDWYVERPCEGCEKALQLAVQHVGENKGPVKPLVVCPDPEGWIVVVEYSNPRVFESNHCRAVYVTSEGRVEDGDKEPLCGYYQAKKECSPARWRARAQP
jgi:hypothetical protein